MLSEFGVSFIINLFSFERSYIGRGLFLIFVGILCFDYVNNLHSFLGRLNLAIGIILIVYGVLITSIGFVGDNKPSDGPLFQRKKK